MRRAGEVRAGEGQVVSENELDTVCYAIDDSVVTRKGEANWRGVEGDYYIVVQRD